MDQQPKDGNNYYIKRVCPSCGTSTVGELMNMSTTPKYRVHGIENKVTRPLF